MSWYNQYSDEHKKPLHSGCSKGYKGKYYEIFLMIRKRHWETDFLVAAWCESQDLSFFYCVHNCRIVAKSKKTLCLNYILDHYYLEFWRFWTFNYQHLDHNSDRIIIKVCMQKYNIEYAMNNCSFHQYID